MMTGKKFGRDVIQIEGQNKILFFTTHSLQIH